MNQDYIIADPWSLIEQGFNPKRVESSESLFSIGNGAFGQRANFEENYSGDTFEGSYIAGVYYPDKTKVGWWKNGYPDYFAKVLNAPSWIGINVRINDEILDLHTCLSVSGFRRELNMKEGWLSRSFKAVLNNGVEVFVSSLRFLSLDIDELGAIRYKVTPLNSDVMISFEPYLRASIKNKDSNWDDKFWDITNIHRNSERSFIEAQTMKTAFKSCTFMQSNCFLNEQPLTFSSESIETNTTISDRYTQRVEKDAVFEIQKFGGYTVKRTHGDYLVQAANKVLDKVENQGFESLLASQKQAWASIWNQADILIEGDVKAQQAIRFNIFQLNQTYLGTDPQLNIGPKGFTGEKYGGSTYWDTEAYCLPFYMATKDHSVARKLLEYRYNHLEKAIENAKKLGFSNGAALYPMVTMNGEECHNEWEITFEEVHRNGAIAFAIFNYQRYTGDFSYTLDKGIEVLIAIARFWEQRFNYSTEKKSYVMLGVTGPNEYENNVNNNFYTNYLAKWCFDFTIETLNKIELEHPKKYQQVIEVTSISNEEIEQMNHISEKIYVPFSKKYNVYLQQDGFLDKELIPVHDLDVNQRPINQNWSWDRILRSPYIKQADTLQTFYFFEDHFSTKQLQEHFDFYEPLTVHESSLSPCIHSIQAAKLGRMDQAYQFYLQTARLDLDDYNQEVHEGLHITSMAGTWMSIVEGFGGMRVKNNTLSFTPQIPSEWKAYTFKVNFRGQIVKVNVTNLQTTFELEGGEALDIIVNDSLLTISPKNIVGI
jgi:maltose phosphorylase|tara:strand:- start:4295 stop:6598 length:2304 start_codon:yes stop_codon:yes gene_type:complete